MPFFSERRQSPIATRLRRSVEPRHHILRPVIAVRRLKTMHRRLDVGAYSIWQVWNIVRVIGTMWMFVAPRHLQLDFLKVVGVPVIVHGGGMVR